MARETACAHTDRCANCAQCAQIGKRRRGAGFRVRLSVRARCALVRTACARAFFGAQAYPPGSGSCLLGGGVRVKVPFRCPTYF